MQSRSGKTLTFELLDIQVNPTEDLPESKVSKYTKQYWVINGLHTCLHTHILVHMYIHAIDHRVVHAFMCKLPAFFILIILKVTVRSNK